MSNTLTPKRIALYVSILTVALILSLSLIFNHFLNKRFNLLICIAPAIITGITIYFVLTKSIETFIYKKIKNIYRTINHSNFQETKQINIDLDNVNQEVLDWAENKTVEIEQLKQNAVYRREFLANVSHELKTPIFNMQGYLHTLIDGGMEDPTINKNYLYKATNNLDRLNAIIQDLEIISQLESGQLSLEMDRFDIILLIKDVFESQEMLADASNVTLSFNNNPDSYRDQKPVYVYADRERIRQVLTNLLSNSIKYGKDNGTTTIDFEELEDNILINISDDGIGIGEKHLPHLFERFYRVDKGRSRSHGGTGLGLSIVKHIIEAHGQSINVNSIKDAGTTFGFTLKKG